MADIQVQVGNEKFTIVDSVATRLQDAYGSGDGDVARGLSTEFQALVSERDKKQQADIKDQVNARIDAASDDKKAILANFLDAPPDKQVAGLAALADAIK